LSLKAVEVTYAITEFVELPRGSVLGFDQVWQTGTFDLSYWVEPVLYPSGLFVPPQIVTSAIPFQTWGWKEGDFDTAQGQTGDSLDDIFYDQCGCGTFSTALQDLAQSRIPQLETQIEDLKNAYDIESGQLEIFSSRLELLSKANTFEEFRAELNFWIDAGQGAIFVAGLFSSPAWVPFFLGSAIAITV